MYQDRLSDSQIDSIEKACITLGEKAAFTSRSMLSVINELRRLQLELKLKRTCACWDSGSRETLN